MEKQKSNFSPSETNLEPTVIIADDDNNDASDDLLAALPLKPQERYKFIRSIGFGGMKGVLLVHDKDTGRDIAMAIMPDFRERPRRDLNRFVREAQITAKLEHPNIVPVHDIGIDASGSPYFTMKYLRGSTLAIILRRLQKKESAVEKYDLDRRLQIFMRVCNAVAFAHSQGVCHLDLKPGNIHCGDFGEVQVIDWGLAATDEHDFSKGVINGTPGYIAPEVIASNGQIKPGPAADIYALGAILYAILTLDSPFSGLPQQEILRQTVAGTLTPPGELTHGLPPGLEAICLKAMALKPEDRYISAKQMRKEITATLSGFPTIAENASPLRKLLLFVGRHIIALTISLLLVLVMLLGLIVYFYSR